MLKNLISYIKDNDYLIGIYEHIIYIYNYDNIIDINISSIKIKLKNRNLLIKGDNLYVKKLENKEISIKGNFKGIEFYE